MIGLAIDPSWINIAAAAGIGGVIVEVVRSTMQRRQVDANVAETITNAATTLLDPLTKANAALTHERDTARRERDEAIRQLEQCRDHLSRKNTRRGY